MNSNNLSFKICIKKILSFNSYLLINLICIWLSHWKYHRTLLNWHVSERTCSFTNWFWYLSTDDNNFSWLIGVAFIFWRTQAFNGILKCLNHCTILTTNLNLIFINVWTERVSIYLNFTTTKIASKWWNNGLNCICIIKLYWLFSWCFGQAFSFDLNLNLIISCHTAWETNFNPCIINLQDSHLILFINVQTFQKDINIQFIHFTIRIEIRTKYL